MSGILGIFHRDGRPVDSDFLDRVKSTLAYRGPDAQQRWHSGNIGLAHTQLRATWEQQHEYQPLTLDNQSWLVGDIRLDRRQDLIAKIGEHKLVEAPDCELVLRAYLRWDEACVDHIAGDFSFGIWDSLEQKLFCARDHFGIKQLYFYQDGGRFLFSNDLRSLLTTGIPTDLNPQALVDFLIFGHNRVPGSTPYARIQSLPAAHIAVVRSADIRISPYWTLPRGEVRYRRQSEYVEHFRELLGRAVHDRMRTDRLSVFMSGGMDSTALAAAARLAQKEGRATEIKAHTMIQEIVAEDPDKRFAVSAAKHIGIPLEFLVMDHYEPLQSAEAFEARLPVPQDASVWAVLHDLYARAAAFGRVAFDGSGSDPIMQPTHADEPLSLSLVRDVALAFPKLLIAHRRLPRIGIRTAFRRAAGKEQAERPSPDDWLRPEHRNDPAFQERRRNEFARNGGAQRAAAYNFACELYWPTFFEKVDLLASPLGLEVRFPFFAIDVMAYVLALPSLPWFVEKHLLREATRGWLPDDVRLRPKTYVAHDFCEARSGKLAPRIAQWRPTQQLLSLIDWNQLLQFSERKTRFRYLELMRAMSLDCWLRSRE